MFRRVRSVLAALALLAATASPSSAASTFFPSSDGYVSGPFSANHITTNVATAVKGSAAAPAGGVLHAITINTKGQTSNTATVAIDGATVAVIDTTTCVCTLIYDLNFSVSLAITTAAGTAADLTVSYI